MAFELFRFAIVAVSKFCELQSAWIVERKPSGNSQAEGGFFFEAGRIHDNNDFVARKKHLIR